MNVTMVWAWMLWLAYAVVNERYYGLGMLWLAYVLVTGRYYGLGMDVMKDMPGHAT